MMSFLENKEDELQDFIEQARDEADDQFGDDAEIVMDALT